MLIQQYFTVGGGVFIKAVKPSAATKIGGVVQKKQGPLRNETTTFIQTLVVA